MTVRTATGGSLRAVLLAACLLTGAWTGVSRAQEYALQPGSTFWIEGRSTLGPFTCEASEVEGHGRLRASSRPSSKGQATVFIPVQDFDCGNRRMNADLYEALHAAEHPFIRFELTDAEALRQSPDTLQGNRLRAM